jgi:type I restriction enzyme S subunit
MSKNGWSEVILEDITTKLGDGLHGTPKYKEDGDYHFINGNNLVNGHIIFNNKTKRVDKLQFHKYKKNLTDRTILVSINGTIGNVAFYNNEKVVLGKSACYFNLNDEIDKGFVRYILQSRIFQSYIESFSTGTTIMNVSLKTMREFAFKLPALQTQKAIAKILGDLDAKIELNRKMNENLEAMAQALFQSWFVDFDPVLDNFLAKNDNNVKALPEPLRKNGAIRLEISKKNTPKINTLFPSNFVFNEVLEKWIPEGWDVESFGDIMESTIGGDWGKEFPDEKHTEQSVIIRGTDIPSLKNNGNSNAPTRYVEAKKLKTRKLKIGDILIEVSGGSPTQSTGRTLYINKNILSRLGGIVEPASFCRRFQPKNILQGILAAEHLTYMYNDGQMWEYQNQSTGIANFQTKFFLENEHLIIPENNEIINKFYSFISEFKLKSTDNNSIQLIKLRDTLLPQLISGKLEVPEAMLEVEKEIV